MQLYWFFLGVLAVWRVTHILHAEDGPWDMFFRLRQRAGEKFWGHLLDCFLCLSLWIAIPFTLLLGTGWKEWPLLWLALSAGAIMLERLTKRQPALPQVAYFEDEEV